MVKDSLRVANRKLIGFEQSSTRLLAESIYKTAPILCSTSLFTSLCLRTISKSLF